MIVLISFRLLLQIPNFFVSYASALFVFLLLMFLLLPLLRISSQSRFSVFPSSDSHFSIFQTSASYFPVFPNSDSYVSTFPTYATPANTPPPGFLFIRLRKSLGGICLGGGLFGFLWKYARGFYWGGVYFENRKFPLRKPQNFRLWRNYMGVLFGFY